MLSFRSGAITFDASHCSQCGACISSCFQGALSIGALQDGIFPILVDKSACNLCRQCVKVCPIQELPNRSLTEEHWSECQQMFLGWSVDPVRRFNSSSGGVARTLIEQCLANGYCDIAWCVGRSEKDGPPRGRLFRKDDDLSLICNSMYEPVLAMAGIPPISRGARMLAVGTNCQLQALDNLLGKRIHLIKVALLCKQQKTTTFAAYIRRLLGVEMKGPLEYRGNGWPGSVRSGAATVRYEMVAGLPFGKGLWRLPACKICPHPLGYGADLTLADPWGITQEPSAAGGMTLIVVRTEQGVSVLHGCRGDLRLATTTCKQVMRSVDWDGIRKKQERIPYYLGIERSSLRRHLYTIGEYQRFLYEHILETFSLPRWLIGVLNRIPYLG